MSADFYSDVKVVPAARSRHWTAQLADAEVCADISGPDEETLHSFDDDAAPDLARIASAYAGKRAPDELGATYVAFDEDRWTEYMEEPGAGASHMSSNYAKLVAIDRAVALPRGVHLLGGRALRRVTTLELDGFTRDWRSLLLRAGGAAGIAAACAPHLDRGWLDRDELATFIDEIAQLALTAKREGNDLLLVGYPAP